MTPSATMALEQVCDEGIINETVQTQECREFAPDNGIDSRHPAPPLMPASPETPLAESIASLMSFMPAMAEQYIRSVQAATKTLTDRVECSEALSPQEIHIAGKEFVESMLEVAEQLTTQRQWLVDEIRTYDGLWQGKVFARIREMESAVESEELKIRTMTDDDAIELSVVMRSISALNEMKAYLKGLKFQIQDSAE